MGRQVKYILLNRPASSYCLETLPWVQRKNRMVSAEFRIVILSGRSRGKHSGQGSISHLVRTLESVLVTVLNPTSNGFINCIVHLKEKLSVSFWNHLSPFGQTPIPQWVHLVLPRPKTRHLLKVLSCFWWHALPTPYFLVSSSRGGDSEGAVVSLGVERGRCSLQLEALVWLPANSIEKPSAKSPRGRVVPLFPTLFLLWKGRLASLWASIPRGSCRSVWGPRWAFLCALKCQGSFVSNAQDSAGPAFWGT